MKTDRTRALQRVVFGKVTNEENARLFDLNNRETALLVPLLILMLFMGVYPRVFLDRSRASVETIRARVNANPAGGSYTTAVISREDAKDAEENSR